MHDSATAGGVTVRASMQHEDGRRQLQNQDSYQQEQMEPLSRYDVSLHLIIHVIMVALSSMENVQRSKNDAPSETKHTELLSLELFTDVI